MNEPPRQFSRASWIVGALTGALAIVGLSTLIGPAWPAPAYGQIPDTALQRKQSVDELRRTNELLTAILEQLRSKVVKVEVVTPEKER